MIPDKKLSFARNKTIIYPIICLTLIIMPVIILKTQHKPTTHQQFTKPIITNISQIITAQGKLEPKDYVDVGTQVSGQIKKIYFSIGDNVKKGDLIAQIDPLLYQAKVDASIANIKNLQAQLTQQQNNLSLTKKEYERSKILIKTSAISKQAVETATTNYLNTIATCDALLAQIDQAKSNLNLDRTNLSYTNIYAPISGTISTQPYKEGQTINSNQTAPTIMQIANLDILTIRAQIAEADIMNLTPNMKVTFSTLGDPDKTWQATIRQILPTPEIVNNVVLYNALSDVDNHNRNLMNGMSVQLFFQVKEATNALTIPANTLGQRIPEKDTANGKAYSIKIKQGDKIIEKIVLVDIITRTNAQIVSGLSKDDLIILPNHKSSSSSNFVPKITPKI